MIEEIDETTPDPTTKKYIEEFRVYCRGFTEIVVPIGFNKPTYKLYDLLVELQGLPHSKGSRPIGLSNEEYEALDSKMVRRKQVQKEFETLLQVEIDMYQGEQDRELQQHMKRNKQVLNPTNISLGAFAT